MEFKDLAKRAKDIKDAYAVLNRIEGARKWGVEEYTQGFVGDVGDLVKLVMAKKGFRFYDENIDQKLAHELADCLWAVMVIASELDVDLETEFVKTMDFLEQKIDERKVIKSKKVDL